VLHFHRNNGFHIRVSRIFLGTCDGNKQNVIKINQVIWFLYDLVCCSASMLRVAAASQSLLLAVKRPTKPGGPALSDSDTFLSSCSRISTYCYVIINVGLNSRGTRRRYIAHYAFESNGGTLGLSRLLRLPSGPHTSGWRWFALTVCYCTSTLRYLSAYFFIAGDKDESSMQACEDEWTKHGWLPPCNVHVKRYWLVGDFLGAQSFTFAACQDMSFDFLRGIKGHIKNFDFYFKLKTKLQH